VLDEVDIGVGIQYNRCHHEFHTTPAEKEVTDEEETQAILSDQGTMDALRAAKEQRDTGQLLEDLAVRPKVVGTTPAETVERQLVALAGSLTMCAKAGDDDWWNRNWRKACTGYSYDTETAIRLLRERNERINAWGVAATTYIEDILKEVE
jgi:hypothetical protein